MAAAEPAGVAPPETAPDSVAEADGASDPLSDAPAASESEGAAMRDAGSAASAGQGLTDERAKSEAVTATKSRTATRVPRPYSDPPARLNGKVFFQRAGTGKDSACSGTAVLSANQSLVWTAGHCVNEGRVNGRAGRYHRRWIFVPAYSSTSPQSAPYGRWRARRLFSTGGWVTRGSFEVDLGAAVVRPLDGETLGARVGGHGILFNQPRDQVWNVFGYPAKGRFAPGNLQYRCTSGPVRDANRDAWSTIRIACDMNDGASGGGWIINVDGTGHGFVNGVNSYQRGARRFFYGPYFGDAAMNLYNRAGGA
jgi:hypothetical protein